MKRMVNAGEAESVWQTLRCTLTSLLEVVKPSKSTRASPIAMAREKEGSSRLDVSSWQLKSVQRKRSSTAYQYFA